MLRILIVTVILSLTNAVEVEEKQTIENDIFEMENHDLSKKIYN